MKKLLYISPHLSTGGLPQYLYKQIDFFKNMFDIQVVEINNSGGNEYVVQKNKIKSLVTVHTLGSDKSEIINIIENFNPDIIHFQEIPQFDLPHYILDVIFKNERSYFIVATTHGSFTNPEDILYHPDRYVLVSEWSKDKFDKIGVETDVWEYPIEDYTPNKKLARDFLGFDDGWKHVLMVGLFTSGKNQKEIFDVARLLHNHKIKFHFIGNQAINFKDYWQPLMETKPDNCIVWGERNDVDLFYQASDLFYFSSKLELNPLSIKEALSWKLPSLFRKLETYKNTYDSNKLVEYITDDISKTCDIILKKLNDNHIDKYKDYVTIVLSYADTEYRKELLKKCINNIPTPIILSSHYPVNTEVQSLTDWTLYERENPLLFKEDYTKYNVFYQYWRLDESGTKNFKDFDFEHSYSVYKLIQMGLNHAKSLGKKFVSIVNYDYILVDDLFEEHINFLKSGNNLVFYRYNELNTHDYVDSYSTGFFSGDIDTLLKYFDKFHSLHDFYSYDDANLCIFEKKVFKFFKENIDKLVELKFDDLVLVADVNQEGVLEFSKS